MHEIQGKMCTTYNFKNKRIRYIIITARTYRYEIREKTKPGNNKKSNIFGELIKFQLKMLVFVVIVKNSRNTQKVGRFLKGQHTINAASRHRSREGKKLRA